MDIFNFGCRYYSNIYALSKQHIEYKYSYNILSGNAREIIKDYMRL